MALLKILFSNCKQTHRIASKLFGLLSTRLFSSKEQSCLLAENSDNDHDFQVIIISINFIYVKILS